MPSFYRKTIRSAKLPDGRKCCVTVTVDSSRVVEALVSVDRHPVAIYQACDSAPARFARLMAGEEVFSLETAETLEERAAELLAHPTRRCAPVTFALLAWAEHLTLREKQKTPEHARIPLGLVKIVQTGPIPSSVHEFNEWVRDCLNRIGGRAKSKTWARQRLHAFVRCLRGLRTFPGLSEYRAAFDGAEFLLR